MSGCIYGAFGPALGVSWLWFPKDKMDQIPNFKTALTNISAPQGRIPRSTRLFAMGHAILLVFPKNRYFSEPVPQILSRGIGHVDPT